MGATNAKYDVQLSPVTSDIDFLTYPKSLPGFSGTLLRL